MQGLHCFVLTAESVEHEHCSHLQADNRHPEEAPSPGVLAHGLLHDGEEDIVYHWPFKLLIVDQCEDVDSSVPLHEGAAWSQGSDH